VDWIRKIHVNQNGWKDVGYHYIIKRDGLIDHGRPVKQIGCHCKGHNRYSIGICLIGGMSEDGVPEDNFTEAQIDRLRKVEHDLRFQFIDIKKTTGHSEYSNKACPCFDVTKKLENHEN
jgi:N-acetylmuramoyl-L-alanine amidase